MRSMSHPQQRCFISWIWVPKTECVHPPPPQNCAMRSHCPVFAEYNPLRCCSRVFLRPSSVQATSATGMNEGSSRSHSVFVVAITQKDTQEGASSARSVSRHAVQGTTQLRASFAVSRFASTRRHKSSRQPLPCGSCWIGNGPQDRRFWSAAGRSENDQQVPFGAWCVSQNCDA